MQLRDVYFEPVLDASGVRGLFGREGFWFHHLPLMGESWWDFSGSVPVGKTMTLNPTAGNMPLQKMYPFQPKKWFPRCIWFSLRHGIALNAVGLSNPGSLVMLYNTPHPPVISFMPVSGTAESRLEEVRAFVQQVQAVVVLDGSVGRHGVCTAIQLNLTCPNTAHDPRVLVHETAAMLDVLMMLEIPIMVKVNVFVTPEAVRGIAAHDACDAIVCSNTIPFGATVPGLVRQVPWDRYFPDGISPLQRRGFVQAGGLSGAPLLPVVCEWLGACA